MSVVRNLMVRAGADFSALNKAMNNATKNAQKFQMDVQKSMDGVRNALAMIGAGFAIGQAIQDAVKVEGAIVSLGLVLGDSADEFIQWANTSAAAFGMSKTEALDFGRTYANLVSGFATSNQEALKLTQDMLKASSVVASMTGRSMTDVLDRIRSGLLGNTEAIEDLGINVNIAMIESTQAFKQFANGQSWAQLSFQTQQQIRYFAILEQASQKFGTKLADTTGSKIMQFTTSLKNLQLALGNAFLPILNVVLPALTSFINTLGTALNYVAAFVRALLGQEEVKPMQKQAKAVAGVGGAFDDAAQSAKAAAKAQKGFLAGFDEINSVPDKDLAGAAGAAAAGASTVQAPQVESKGLTKAFDAVKASAEKMADKVKAAFGSISEFVQRHKDIIIAAISGITFALATYVIATKGATLATAAFTKALRALRAVMAFFAALIAPWVLVAYAIAAAVAAVVYFYRTNEKFRGVVDKIIKAITDAFVWLWKNVLIPVGLFLKDVFLAAWEGIKVAAEALWKEVLVPLGEYLLIFYDMVIKPLAALLKDVLTTAFQRLSKVALAFYQLVLIPLSNAFGNNLKPTMAAVASILKVLWEAFKTLFTYVGVTVMAILAGLIKVMNFWWQNVMKPVSEFLSNVFLSTFKRVFETVGGIIDGFSTTIKGLMTFIEGVFTLNWKKAWTGIKDIFVGIFKAMVSFIKMPFNAIIDMMNAIIDGMNMISIDVPEWAGGYKFGINIPKIPRLAEGGIVNGPTMALIGEAGSEMVVPLENTSFVDKLAGALGTAVMSAMQVGQGMNQSQSKDVVIQIDGNTLARVLNPYQNKEGARVGSSLISIT